MAKFTTSIKVISQDIAQEILGQVNSQKSNLQNSFDQIQRKNFRSPNFSKSPIDTALSLNTSLAQVSVNLKTLSVLVALKIITPYASFFTDPQSSKNPNFKFGKRSPGDESISQVTDILIQTLN